RRPSGFGATYESAVRAIASRPQCYPEYRTVGSVLLRNSLLAAVAGILLFSVAYPFRRPWREYPAFEYENFPVPPDYQEKAEWLFARLMYPPVYGNRLDRKSVV